MAMAAEVSAAAGPAAHGPVSKLTEQTLAWAYPDTFSLLPGESLKLHVSCTTQKVAVRIYRLTDYGGNVGTWSAPPRIEMRNKATGFSSQEPNNAGGGHGPSGVNDWNWPLNIEVQIPGNWPTGIYVAEISAEIPLSAPAAPVPAWVIFVVRNPAPVEGQRMLYKFDLNTIQAYNLATHPYVVALDDGFAPFNNDLYNNPATAGGAQDYKTTLRRPVWMWSWSAKSVAYDYPLVKWIEQQGYAADFCTDLDVDLDTNLTMLSKYPMLISPGHDEYWGPGMYDHLKRYRDGGGNLVILSGNTCCWRVNYTDTDPQYNIPTAFICDKGPTPLCDTDGPDAWWKLSQKDSKLIGPATRNAAIRSDIPSGPFQITCPRSPGFRVQNADHWVFEGTGLKDGDTIGVNNMVDINNQPIIENLIGYEENGSRIKLNADGSGTLTFADGTPQNFVLLGVAPTMPMEAACSRTNCGTGGKEQWWAFHREAPGDQSGDYAATMGYFTAGGGVFNAATTHWANILNAWDTDAGYWRNVPKQWQSGHPTVDQGGHPILGNPYLHRITRNVIDRFFGGQPPAQITTGNQLPTTFDAPAGVTVADLDGDGNADIVLQSAGNGDVTFWLLSGATRSSTAQLGAPASGKRVVGTGNITAPDALDLVVQDEDDSSLECWTLQLAGDTVDVAARTPIKAEGGSGGLEAVAVLDIDGDGRADILFQNKQNGSLTFWLLDDTTLREAGPFVQDFADTAFRIAGTPDLNGDGRPDILFQNVNDGSLFYWIMNGQKRIDFGPFDFAEADPKIRVVGCGVVAGTPSILLQNQAGGFETLGIEGTSAGGRAPIGT